MDSERAEQEAELALIAEGVIGRDVDDFMRSELGQVMLGLARQDLEWAVRALRECQADDAAKNAFLRAECNRHEQFAAYMHGLYQRGLDAIRQVESRNAESMED